MITAHGEKLTASLMNFLGSIAPACAAALDDRESAVLCVGITCIAWETGLVDRLLQFRTILSNPGPCGLSSHGRVPSFTNPSFRSPSINTHIKDITFGGFGCPKPTGVDILACLSAFPRHATPTALTFVHVQDLEDVLRMCATTPPIKHRLATVDKLTLKVCASQSGFINWHVNFI